MYELIYTLVWMTGAVSLLFAIGLYQWHQEVELFAAVSLACWAVLTFASDNVEVLDQTGTAHQFGSFAVQLLCVGLALVSLAAIVGAATGRWPEEYQTRQEAPV